MRITNKKTNIKGVTTEVTFKVGNKEYTRKVKKDLITFKKVQYFIFDNETLREVPQRLQKDSFNTWHGWNGYENDLKEVANFYSVEQKSETLGRPNGNGHMSVYNGEIKVRKDHTIHGGTYGFNRYLPYAFTIGSNVDRDIAEKISTEVAYISKQYTDLTISDKKPYFISKYGTSYSTYGLGS